MHYDYKCPECGSTMHVAGGTHAAQAQHGDAIPGGIVCVNCRDGVPFSRWVVTSTEEHPETQDPK